MSKNLLVKMQLARGNLATLKCGYVISWGNDEAIPQKNSGVNNYCLHLLSIIGTAIEMQRLHCNRPLEFKIIYCEAKKTSQDKILNSNIVWSVLFGLPQKLKAKLSHA